MTTALAFLTALLALQAGSPGLQQRPKGEPADQLVKVVREGGQSVLPEDAYGLYRFPDKDSGKSSNFGAGLQINEQFGEISGYITVPGGKNTMASYFLSEVKGGNGHFSFATRQVHGLWYSFEGHVEHGAGATAGDDGYYQMIGILTAHDETAKTTQDRAVTLKLTGQHQMLMH
jgi:hypothetical protein